MEGMSPSYKGHRYTVEVISHCVWQYFRFPLSFREAEELMLERGVIVSYETVRRWCLKFGQQYANGLRRRRPQPGGKWHLDEVFIKINGEQKYPNNVTTPWRLPGSARDQATVQSRSWRAIRAMPSVPEAASRTSATAALGG